MKKNTYCVTVELGKVNYGVKAKSEEDAIFLANKKAWKIKKKDAIALTIPKIIKIDGKDYRAPPTKVFMKGASS